ncbi:MAG: hypothetical protein MRERV_78c003 [Mycoplasmataceae bacterium RV_VA103A]|nr:MAG: hypothetical protein MRERV_78c003 [Mycoplasmataceae bacterium RV_VA103A]
MTEKELATNNMSAKSSEVPTNQQQKEVDKKIITLQGITTSQIRTREKLSDTPAYCFLKLTTRFCQHCEEVEEKQSRCGRPDCGYYDENCGYLEQDIPVIFRIKEKQCQIEPCIGCGYHPDKTFQISEKQLSCQIRQLKHRTVEVWIKPKIKKGSYLQVEGHFADSDKSRPSFTAYSYQILSSQPATEDLSQVEQIIN